MSGRFTEFLIDRTGKSPRNLSDSIERVTKASDEFRDCWLNRKIQDALQSSHDAFEDLDYIQNELLRQRDAHKNSANSWASSKLKLALDAETGSFGELSQTDLAWFQSLEEGTGAMPAGFVTAPLSLDIALNKLKHRATSQLNFSLPAAGRHLLYVFTPKAMGKPDTLSEIDLHLFCIACKSASNHV